MKTIGIMTGCIIIVLMSFVPISVAQDLSKYFISFRLVANAGTGTHEHFGLLLDGRQFITDRIDLGISYQGTEPQVVEMPGDIEKLAPSGEIDGEGTRQVFSFYSLFHPFGRDRTIDYYVGASLNYQLLDVDDTTGNDYYIVVDSPPAFGISAKAGANWFFHKHIGLTADIEAGPVFHDYSAEDQISGLSEDLDSPDFVYLLSIGISVRF